MKRTIKTMKNNRERKIHPIKLSLAMILIMFNVSGCVIASDYKPGEVIVKLAPRSASFGAAALQSEKTGISAQLKQDWIKTMTPVSLGSSSKAQVFSGQAHTNKSAAPVYLVTIDDATSVEDAITMLQDHPDVTHAEPNYYVETHTLTTSSWTGHPDQAFINETGLKYVRNLPIVEHVQVAVIDSGIHYVHPNLETNIVKNEAELVNGVDDDQNDFVDDRVGYNFSGYSSGAGSSNTFDGVGHGTHIAGIIGAYDANPDGVTGIDPSANIMNVRFLDRYGRGTQLDAAAAIYYAIENGAKVINCSWGYHFQTSVLADAVAEAEARGVIIVASAGNDNSSVPQYPAAYDSVICVSSIKLNHEKSWFSNWGEHVDFAAYGDQIYSTFQTGYTKMSGTSQSAAIVSGMISRLWSANPSWSKEKIVQVLNNAALDLNTSGHDVYTGAGVIQSAGLFSASGQSVPGPDIDLSGLSGAGGAPTLQDVLNFPNPFKQYTNFGFNTDQSGEVKISVYDIRGQKQREISGVSNPGYNSFVWNGLDEFGNLLGNGTYFYVVEVAGGGGKTVKKGKLTLLN